MDTLYETISMPKPPKKERRDKSPHSKKESRKKGIRELLIKLNFFGNDRLRRDSTATTTTALSIMSCDSIIQVR